MVQSPDYTGLNAGAGMVRGGGEKATQALKEYGQTVLEADKFKYGERKKEESDFLEAIKTKPEFVISAKAREEQAKALTDFNQRYAPLIKKGYLTMEEKTAMANDRAALEAMQQQQLANYQQYLGMKEAMMKDTQGRFDKEEFRQWEEDYQQSGQFDHATMPLQGVSPSIFLQKNPVPGTETWDAKTSSKLSGTPQEAQRWIREQAYTNETFRIGLIKEFKSLSPSDKARYLDTDNSGTVSPQEAQAGEGIDVSKPDNPILKYALEKYTNTAIGVKAMKPNKPSTRSSAKNSNKIELFGKWTDFAPGNQGIGTVKYKETPYADHIDFDGTFKLSNINSRDGLILRGETSKKITKAGVVEGTLKYYIPSEDVFVISAVGTDPDIDIGTLIEIPAKNLNQKEINKMPVVVNGTKTTLGSLRQSQTGSTSTTTAPAEGTKKKYFNSVTGKWEYR